MSAIPQGLIKLVKEQALGQAPAAINNDYLSGFEPNPVRNPDEIMPMMTEEELYPRKVNGGNPFKSTTHEERYYHIRTSDGKIDGTVFLRQEINGTWYGACAYRSPQDQPNRRIGRQVSRRKYFQSGCAKSVPEPTYEEAEKLYYECWVRNFR